MFTCVCFLFYNVLACHQGVDGFVSVLHVDNDNSDCLTLLYTDDVHVHVYTCTCTLYKHVHLDVPPETANFSWKKITALGQLCSVALSFCCVVLPYLVFLSISWVIKVMYM